MPLNLIKIFIVLCFLVSACNEIEQETRLYRDFINQGNAVVVIADNNQCWNCEKYYWVLRRMIAKNPDLRVLWVTRKLKASEKKKLDKELDLVWTDAVKHIEDTPTLRGLKSELQNNNSRVLLYCGEEIKEFIGDGDVDKMAKEIAACF